jgi:hypothetical protein
MGTMNTAVFWVTATYSLVEVDRRYKSPYCLHHQGDGLITSEKSANFYQNTRRNTGVGCHSYRQISCEDVNSVGFNGEFLWIWSLSPED